MLEPEARVGLPHSFGFGSAAPSGLVKWVAVVCGGGGGPRERRVPAQPFCCGLETAPRVCPQRAARRPPPRATAPRRATQRGHRSSTAIPSALGAAGSPSAHWAGPGGLSREEHLLPCQICNIYFRAQETFVTSHVTSHVLLMTAVLNFVHTR